MNIPPEIRALIELGAEDILFKEDGLYIKKNGKLEKKCSFPVSKMRYFVNQMATKDNTAFTTKNNILETIITLENNSFGRVIALDTPSARGLEVVIRVPTQKVLSEAQLPKNFECLLKALEAKQNVILAGSTGSGKTLLLKTLLSMLFTKSNERIILIEDTAELIEPNVYSTVLRTTSSKSIRDLIRASLRMVPDRIMIGEIRGGEAWDLLKAWNTGHSGGATTLHANSVKSIPGRVSAMMNERHFGNHEDLILESVDLFVHVERKGKTNSLNFCKPEEILKNKETNLYSVH